MPLDVFQRPKWGIKLSVFKGYKFDTSGQFKKCFKLDYKLTRIPTILKEKKDRTSLKKLLQKNYKHIKNAYLYYSSFGNTKFFCINMLSFSEFCHKIGLITEDYSS